MFWQALLLAALAAPLGGGGERAVRRGALFSFNAGAPLFAPPAVARDGSVYAGSSEGYVHALAADGSYRWSYTVRGRVVASPVFDELTRRLFVATSEAKLYALEHDARLRWVFALPAAPQSELLLTDKGMLYFVGVDQHLYGLTTGGALRLRIPAFGAAAAPEELAGERVPALLFRSSAEPAKVDTLGLLRGFVWQRQALGFGLDARQLALETDGGVATCGGGRARVLSREGTPIFDSGSDCVAAPRRAADVVAIAEARRVVVVRRGQWRALELGGVPLRPVFDGPRQRLLVSSASGRIESWSLGAIFAGAPE